jgi:protein O-mannosyl-transferase
MQNGQKMTWPGRTWLLALLLLAVTFAAYQPVWRITFFGGEGIDADLHSWQGLGHIWSQQGEKTEAGQAKAYYPLAFTTYWLEYRLWGSNPLGYYLVNTLLFGLNAVLLWIVLRRLRVPGAWLAAGLWALHPVNVESVAQIAERKNCLSGLFFLCSILAALKYWLPELFPQSRIGSPQLEVHRPPSTANPASSVPSPSSSILNRNYWIALALFICGLLSKTSVIPLPAAILLLVWWKRGRLAWADVWPSIPFFAAGLAIGFDTMHVEHNFSQFVSLGNRTTVFTLPLVDRFLIAGKDVWFYLGKLLWPHPLIYNYPRWKIDPSSVTAWLQLLAVPALLLFLWFKRHSWGRAGLVALLYFLALLAPTLSFLNAIFFRQSYVADHYQYLACMGPIALSAAALTLAFSRQRQSYSSSSSPAPPEPGEAGPALQRFNPSTLQRLGYWAISICLLTTLGALTWKQCRIYKDSETLCETTLVLNPDAWLVHDQLGEVLIGKGQLDAGIAQIQTALQIQPDPRIYCKLGDALLAERKPAAAIACFRNALQMQPDAVTAYDGLGRACLATGQTDEAIQNFRKALDLEPGVPMAWYNLGTAYIQKDQLDLAIQSWQKAVTLQPDFPRADNNLGNAFLLKGQVAEAVQYWRIALAAQPNLVSAQVNLAWVLATCPDASLRDGTGAVALAERAYQLSGGENPNVLRTLAAAFAENGQMSYAVAAAQQALQLANLRGNRSLAASIQEQMQFYKNNQPFRDTTMAGH